MLVNTQPGAIASTLRTADLTNPATGRSTAAAPSSEYETVRHLLFGSLTAVQLTIKDLHKKHYADPNDWSKPISTGRPNEVMAILTKRVRVA